MHDYPALISSLQAKGVHSLLPQFTDIHGVAKGKLVPVENLKEWVEVGAGFAGPSIWGTGLPRFGARSEYYGRILPETIRPLPFMPGVAHAVCEGFAGGQPLETCSRQVLKTALARLRERGWTMWVGIEPEYFLLKRSEGRWRVADAEDHLAKPSYDLKSIYRNSTYLDDMRQTLVALGFDLQQIDHEDASGQYEVNYRFDEALAAADRFMLFKVAAHAVAERHGMVFSGMPKPLAGSPGSGLHFHISITNSQGEAVFSHEQDPLGLSVSGHQFAAGLLAHADALAAICAPTVNSYKRLASTSSASGTTWAPVWKAYGDNNRTCLVRTVAGRLEWRLPDPSCNVYAALAATLLAGLDGVDKRMQPPEPCDQDLYAVAAGGGALPAALPRNLLEALDALDNNQSLSAAVGTAFVDQFLKVKHAEWCDFHQHVSEWELNRYANAY